MLHLRKDVAEVLAVLAVFAALVTALFLWSAHLRPWASSGESRFHVFPILQIRDFCSCLAVVVAALVWQRFRWRWFNALFGVFLLAAPISYGLYCLHYVIALRGSFFASLPMGKERLLIGGVVSFAAAWFAEVPFQRCVNRWTRFLPNRALPSRVEIASARCQTSARR